MIHPINCWSVPLFRLMLDSCVVTNGVNTRYQVNCVQAHGVLAGIYLVTGDIWHCGQDQELWLGHQDIQEISDLGLWGPELLRIGKLWNDWVCFIFIILESMTFRGLMFYYSVFGGFGKYLVWVNRVASGSKGVGWFCKFRNMDYTFM